MNILKELKTSAIVTLVLLVICCGVYPLVIFGAGQLLFPHQANGSLVLDSSGKPIASTLLAQNFAADKYFNPRASAAGTGYDSTSSGGSNYGATSQALHDAVKQRVADYRKANNLPDTQPVPAIFALSMAICMALGAATSPKAASASTTPVLGVSCTIFISGLAFMRPASHSRT